MVFCSSAPASFFIHTKAWFVASKLMASTFSMTTSWASCWVMLTVTCMPGSTEASSTSTSAVAV